MSALMHPCGQYATHLPCHEGGARRPVILTSSQPLRASTSPPVHQKNERCEHQEGAQHAEDNRSGMVAPVGARRRSVLITSRLTFYWFCS